METLNRRCQGCYLRSSISKAGARRLCLHSARRTNSRGQSTKQAATHGRSWPYGHPDKRSGPAKERQFSLHVLQEANCVPPSHPKGDRARDEEAIQGAWLTHLFNVCMHVFCTTACILASKKKKKRETSRCGQLPAT